MTELLPQVVPALAMALLHFLWQGAVVGALAWSALSLLKHARPQLRYAVACAAFTSPLSSGARIARAFACISRSNPSAGAVFTARCNSAFAFAALSADSPSSVEA